ASTAAIARGRRTAPGSASRSSSTSSHRRAARWKPCAARAGSGSKYAAHSRPDRHTRARMARISFVPQRREFFDLYNRASANLVDISRLLVRLLDNFPNDRDTLAREIKDAEHEGDRLTHDVVDLLNRTFVTPFDRDDMYRLAGALDDVCDHIDEAAGNILGYGVTQIRENAHQQAAVIERAATKLRDAVGKLEGFKDSKRELI